MIKLKFIFIFTFCLCIFLEGSAQTEKTIDSLQNQYQNCLNKGERMLECTKKFYFQIDSMLNVVYFKQYSTLNKYQKAKFKTEQKDWLIKRDAYFKKTLKKFKIKNPDISPYGPALGAQDDSMFMYDDNAKFVMSRVLVLIKRLLSR